MLPSMVREEIKRYNHSMSDEDKDVDQATIKETKPVRVSGRRLEVISNLQSVYRTDPSSTPLRDVDIKSRQTTLERMGVDNSWYSEGELMGSDGVTPWPDTLEGARQNWMYQKAAENFTQDADLSKPITDPNNSELVMEMSDYDQKQARQQRAKDKEKQEKDKQQNMSTQ